MDKKKRDYVATGKSTTKEYAKRWIKGDRDRQRLLELKEVSDGLQKANKDHFKKMNAILKNIK